MSDLLAVRIITRIHPWVSSLMELSFVGHFSPLYTTPSYLISCFFSFPLLTLLFCNHVYPVSTFICVALAGHPVQEQFLATVMEIDWNSRTTCTGNSVHGKIELTVVSLSPGSGSTYQPLCSFLIIGFFVKITYS